MNQTVIFYPVMALVALTFFVGFNMLRSRFSAVKNGQVSIKYFQLNRDGIPDKMQRLSDKYDNLLSMPILFYLVTLMVFVVHVVDVVDEWYLVLAWLYVGVRFIHSYIHCVYNNVIHRVYAFVLSVVMLIVIWLRLFFHLITNVVL